MIDVIMPENNRGASAEETTVGTGLVPVLNDADKQAEFLVYNQFPFDLVRRIGVQIGIKAMAALTGSSHRPAIETQPDWYF